MTKLFRSMAASLALLVSATALPAPAEQVPPVSLERAISEAFDRRDYERAARLCEQSIAERPGNPYVLYNAGCAHSRLGNLDTACSYLFKAVEAGFRNFDHMRRDPDLAAVREHPVYTAILEADRRVDEAERRRALQRWRDRYGDEQYRYEHDESRSLAYATALDAVAHDEMRQMLEQQADHLIATFFEAPPDYPVLVAVPTPRDARDLFRDDSIGGIYQHHSRRLISRDIGSSLRHEFFHLMHYGHMERIGQVHPIWVQEGMAALYESYDLADDGSITFRPNERHNIIRRRARSGRTMKWNELLVMDGDAFMRRAGHLYPQVRSIFEYIAENGHLQEWYAAYVRTFDEDRSGARAMELIFGKPLEDIERQWRVWAAERPELDVNIGIGDAALGIEAEPRSGNDGVRVARVLPGSTAQRASIRIGDVIVAVDGEPTRSMMELRSVIGARSVGQRVLVRIRRDERYLERELVLRPLMRDSPRRRRR